MASGSTLSTLLAGLKAHAGAAAVAGAVVVGGGAAAAAAATGHLGNNSSDKGAPSTATQVANCVGHNGDAANLAATYKSMFGGDATTATKDICTIFVGTSGRHFGLGEVRQILNIAATIENKGSSACLSAASASDNSGDSSDHGQPTATPGKSDGDHGRPTATPGSSGDHDRPTATPGDHGQPSLKIPSASAADTMANVQSILSHVDGGVSLAKLAQSCGAPLGSNE